MLCLEGLDADLGPSLRGRGETQAGAPGALAFSAHRSLTNVPAQLPHPGRRAHFPFRGLEVTGRTSVFLSNRFLLALPLPGSCGGGGGCKTGLRLD